MYQTPEFNLQQYLAESNDRKDSVAPYAALMVNRETKTAPPTPFIEYPKAVKRADGSDAIANSAEEEAAFIAADRDAVAGGGAASGSSEESPEAPKRGPGRPKASAE